MFCVPIDIDLGTSIYQNGFELNIYMYAWWHRCRAYGRVPLRHYILHQAVGNAIEIITSYVLG